jgi:hypothetical protein
MPKRLSKPRRREIADPNLSAFRVIEHITRDEPKQTKKVVRLPRTKNAAAVALGRKGGLKSAEVRMEKIAPEERRRIASNAARERWRKEKGDG